jgi:hypothetical protein
MSLWPSPLGRLAPIFLGTMVPAEQTILGVRDDLPEIALPGPGVSQLPGFNNVLPTTPQALGTPRTVARRKN